MSTIKVDAFQDTSGVGFYPARAWANINQVGTMSIRDDKNVSSITDSGVGRTTVTWTNAAPNANYSMPCAAADHSTGAARFAMPGDGNSQTAANCQILVDNSNSDAQDADRVHVSAIWD